MIKLLPGVRILSGLDAEALDNPGRDPSRTGFLPRERFLVQNNGLNVVLSEFPGTGRSGRSPTDDDDFDIDHGPIPVVKNMFRFKIG